MPDKPAWREGLLGKATGVLLMLSLAGCGTAPKSQSSAADYLSDAGQCSRASQAVSTVRVRTAAARMDLPVELGMDGPKYRQCMEARGWAPPNPAQDPYFRLVLRCRSAATQITQAPDAEVHLGGRPDEAAYSECMKRGGIQGEVIVHPLKPK